MRSIAVCALLGLAPLSAAELDNVDLSGSARLGGWSDISSSFAPKNFANYDIDLLGRFQSDAGVALSVGVRARSVDSAGQISSPVYGRGRISNNATSGLELDRFSVDWSPVADQTYSFGSFRYQFAPVRGEYLYSDPAFVAAGLAERRVVGVGAKLEGLTAYIGIPAERDEAVTAYADFRLPLIQRSNRRLVVQPMAEGNMGTRSRNPWTLALDADWQERRGELAYLVRGVGSMVGSRDDGRTSYGVLVEPALEWRNLVLGGSGYFAWLGKEDSLGLAAMSLPVQRYATVEPSVLVGDFALQLPVSWHDPLTSVRNDDFLMVTPGVRWALNDSSTVRIFGGVRAAREASGSFARGSTHGIAGLEARVRF